MNAFSNASCGTTHKARTGLKSCNNSARSPLAECMVKPETKPQEWFDGEKVVSRMLPSLASRARHVVGAEDELSSASVHQHLPTTVESSYSELDSGEY